MLLLCITCGGQFVDNACAVCARVCVRAEGLVMLMLVCVSAVFASQLFADHGRGPASGPQTGQQLPPVTEMHYVYSHTLDVFYSCAINLVMCMLIILYIQYAALPLHTCAIFFYQAYEV